MTLSDGSAAKHTPNATLHVVVTCTERKTVEPEVRAADLRAVSLPERVEAWTKALENASGPAESADALYAGDHWQVARSIARHNGNGPAVNIWVASAGYGLVRLDTPLHSYAATFAGRHADCVVPRHAEFSAAEWWSNLACWRPKGYAGPRTLKQLSAAVAKDDPSFLLISVSESYAAALSEDIRAAAACLPDRIGVVSIGANGERRSAAVAALAGLTISGDARLRAIVGGAMQSLNVRITQQIVAETLSWFPSFRRLTNLTTSWLDSAPPAVVYDRVKLNDDAVREFILNALQADPAATHTGLLRKLRDDGQACEQSRFRALFQEATRLGSAGKQSLPERDHPVAAHDSALPAPSL